LEVTVEPEGTPTTLLTAALRLADRDEWE
jgi:hypothetical protein